MSDVDWRREYRDATAAPPRGAKERVWRRLEGELRPVRWWLPAAALAAAALVAFVAWPRTQTTSWRTDGAVVSVKDARYSYDAPTRTLSLERGTLTASVWKGPALHVVAQGRTVDVEAAVVVVSVAGDTVTVTPVEGAVLVDHQWAFAPRPAPATAAAQAAAAVALEPDEAQGQRAAAFAEVALSQQRFEEAAQAFADVARTGSLGAEAALFKKGEVELRHLAAPERALATFDDGDARFPAGSLSAERALSALEALSGLGRWADVEARAARFLTDFSSSERRGDVRLLHVRALFELGRTAEVCAEVPGLTGDSARPWRARCSE